MLKIPKLEIFRTTKKIDTLGTLGSFLVNGEKRANTIECPWIPDENRLGGLGFKSCVPEGDYELIPVNSPNFGKCFYLQNKDLDVYAFKEDIQIQGQRYRNAFAHRGSYVRNFVGCIGTGDQVLCDYMITNTRTTCKRIMAELYTVKKYMQIEENLTISIRWEDEKSI